MCVVHYVYVVPAYECVGVHACVCPCTWMQRTEEDIQVSSFIAVYCIILKQDLLLNQRLADSASLAVQGTPGILLSLP